MGGRTHRQTGRQKDGHTDRHTYSHNNIDTDDSFGWKINSQNICISDKNKSAKKYYNYNKSYITVSFNVYQINYEQ